MTATCVVAVNKSVFAKVTYASHKMSSILNKNICLYLIIIIRLAMFIFIVVIEEHFVEI
jgi:hypothetical protein